MENVLCFDFVAFISKSCILQSNNTEESVYFPMSYINKQWPSKYDATRLNQTSMILMHFSAHKAHNVHENVMQHFNSIHFRRERDKEKCALCSLTQRILCLRNSIEGLIFSGLIHFSIGSVNRMFHFYVECRQQSVLSFHHVSITIIQRCV